MNKCIALIPARYAASRFPGKLMKLLAGKPVILHTYEATLATGLFEEVVVATDSDEIFSAVRSVGGNAVMSQRQHESGSDRIAETAAKLDAGIIVNVQGDTPFVKKEALKKLLDLFSDPVVQVASLMQVITKDEDVRDPNFVKVVVANNMDALFFSRSPLPYPRDLSNPIIYYEHIGVYAFRKQALLDFTKWPVSKLESIEKIECLRYLENGVAIRMAVVDYMGVEIDTPEDMNRAASLVPPPQGE